MHLKKQFITTQKIPSLPAVEANSFVLYLPLQPYSCMMALIKGKRRKKKILQNIASSSRLLCFSPCKYQIHCQLHTQESQSDKIQNNELCFQETLKSMCHVNTTSAIIWLVTSCL